MIESAELPAAESSTRTPEIAVKPMGEERNSPRLRAFLVGLPLLIGVCIMSVYGDMVSKVIQFGVLQFAAPAIAVLVALAIANRLLLRWFKSDFLSRADLVTIYAMLVVGVLVSTRGVIEKLIPPLVFLPYYQTPENRWSQLLTQHLPGWAVPFVPSAKYGLSPEVVRGFWESNRSGTVPWSAWVGPLAAWFGLIMCVVIVFTCLATLLRRQWMDNEQLRFPLTILPLAIMRDEIEGQPFFSNRLMWAGFAFAVSVFLLNGIQANFPVWPHFVTSMWLDAYFTERPWNGMAPVAVYISLAAIGFAYFLPLDLLFSLWFFFLLTRFQDIAAIQLGGVPTGIVTHDARIWTGFQAAGGYLVLIAAQARIGWPYYKQVWKTAWGKSKPLDDSTEMMSYRTAIIGLILSFGGIIVWLSLAGMNPILAAAQMGIYLFFIAVIMSRAVSEAGLLMTETSFLPSHLINLVYPLPGMGATNITMMGLTNTVFTRDLRGILLSSFFDAQKMAGEVKMRQRSLLFPLLLAVVVSFVTASAFFLKIHYVQGGISLYSYPTGNARNMFTMAAGQIGGEPLPRDATAWGGLISGGIITAILIWMRAMFTWSPFHPLAFVIAPTWAMLVLWFPFFIAWVIKSLTMRFGGVDTFRKLAPFMLGMVFGEFMSAVFWAVMNMWRGWSVPNFPWP